MTDQKVIIENGKGILSTVPRPQMNEAKEVARLMVDHFKKAMQTFSVGSVGSAINSSAPVILRNKAAVLPNLPILSPSQVTAMRDDALCSLLQPEFEKALDGFQYNLASAKFDDQAKLLEQFGEINWEAISKGSPSEPGLWDRVQAFFHTTYLDKQLRAAEKANLSDLIILCQIPQFTQMLVLAKGYSELMMSAYYLYQSAKQELEKDMKNNGDIVTQLEKVLDEFTEAELTRLEATQLVDTLTGLLEKSLETAEILAGLNDRTDEMTNRVKLAADLNLAMTKATSSTLRGGEKEVEEFSKQIYLLSYNLVRKSKVKRALHYLILYIKSYIAFEYLLALAQVYSISASMAIQDLIFQNIQQSTGQIGMDFFLENIKPLENLVESFSRNFKLPGPKEILEGEVKDVTD